MKEMKEIDKVKILIEFYRNIPLGKDITTIIAEEYNTVIIRALEFYRSNQSFGKES